MPRKRHVSRNKPETIFKGQNTVMPRKRHVSRNFIVGAGFVDSNVMPRKRHVSRNVKKATADAEQNASCLARGM